MSGEKRPTKLGLELLKPMTLKQAFRYGERNMPKDLKRNGFKTVIFVSGLAENGSLFFRINFAK